MADDQSQRPFRSDLQGRSTPAANNPSPGGNDPLAELARLIGQSDPFGEFGREGARQAAMPPVSEVEPMLRGLAAQGAAQGARHNPYAAEPQPPVDDFGRQPFGSAPLAGGGELYQTQGAVPGYEDAGYDPNMPLYAGEDQDYYDDMPPPRRRMGVLAIAAVFALAVVGTAGAFGYRTLFGGVNSGPPPVIKADSKPVKIVPEKDKDQSAKLINDRINERPGDQKLVSREEKPVDLNQEKSAGVLTPQDQAMAGSGAMQTPPLGSGVIGSDPKKVHTITIRPDQPAVPGTASAAPAPAETNMVDATPEPPAPQPAAAPAVHAAKPAPAPRPVATHRPAPAPQHRVAVASSNAPLSLTPDSVSAMPVTAARPTPVRAPAQPAPVAASGSHGYAVQVSSRRSEADAQAALNRVKSQFSGVLGGQQVMVKRVDLGAKGVYYRAMVGPFGSSGEASQVCSRLKAAGGSCFVQRI